MAQTNAAREPSMEEILASIRRIIESNDTSKPQTGDGDAAPAESAKPQLTSVEGGLAEQRSPAAQEKPVTAKAPVSSSQSPQPAAAPSAAEPSPAAPVAKPVEASAPLVSAPLQAAAGVPASAASGSARAISLADVAARLRGLGSRPDSAKTSHAADGVIGIEEKPSATDARDLPEPSRPEAQPRQAAPQEAGQHSADEPAARDEAISSEAVAADRRVGDAEGDPIASDRIIGEPEPVEAPAGAAEPLKTGQGRSHPAEPETTTVMSVHHKADDRTVADEAADGERETFGRREAFADGPSEPVRPAADHDQALDLRNATITPTNATVDHGRQAAARERGEVGGSERGLLRIAGDRGALTSPMTGEKVAAAFDDLNDALLRNRMRALDDIAEDLMRPLLREWLDDNLPTLVEKLVREEIERVARGGRN